MIFVCINEDTQVSKLDDTTCYSSKSFLSHYMFQSKKKFTHIKSKTSIKLKISLANVKILIDNECFKTFSGNIAWLELYALSSCYEKPRKKCPSKKRFGYILGHLSFWVSGMEPPLIFLYQKRK